MHYLDNDQIFFADGKFQKDLFDSNDGSGIHVSDEGAKELYESFTAFFFEGESDELEPATPLNRKRDRGSSSSTPPSATRKMKQAKNIQE